MRLSLSTVRSRLLLAMAVLTLVPLTGAAIYVFLVVPGLLEQNARRDLFRDVSAKRANITKILGRVVNSRRQVGPS